MFVNDSNVVCPNKHHKCSIENVRNVFLFIDKQSQKKTRFPEWHETFTFLLPSADVDFTVTITVMDKDRIRSDDFMGRVSVVSCVQ